LQRVGGKYPDIWHFQHMLDPRSTSPGSTMPNYPWLFRQQTDLASMESKIRVQRMMGVPFPERTAEEIKKDSLAQAQGIVDELAKSGVEISPDKEIIALIAYMQQLGKYRPPPAKEPAGNPGLETLIEEGAGQARVE
jgi:cytochrome c oxidase cbb3-type subunit I/II